VGEWAGGTRGAARAVGSAMKQNPVALIVPCHRSACHLKLNFLGLEKSKAKVHSITVWDSLPFTVIIPQILKQTSFLGLIYSVRYSRNDFIRILI
jgi:hypothetical protein